MDNNYTTYFNILVDTLKKKEIIIDGLLAQTEEQSRILETEEPDLDAFGACIDSKSELLDRLASLDEGFMDLYGRVAEAMKQNTLQYKSQIEEAKELIRRQTSKTTSLVALEERNKQKLSLFTGRSKQKIKDFKISSKTAAAYYKNMTGKHQDGDSYFLDRKK